MAYDTKTAPVPTPLTADFIRGGTSKGVFLLARDLPAAPSFAPLTNGPSQETIALWSPILLSLMGSPDPYGRQLDGMGGGVSSLSKAVVVAPYTGKQAGAGVDAEGKGGENVDVDVIYTFAQVGIREAAVDYSGNCGNLTSVVGAFAVDAGLCRARPVPPPNTSLATLPTHERRGVVRLLNTNTQKIIHTSFPIDEEGKPLLHLPEVAIAGVPGHAARIPCDYLDPAGARTGKLLPAGEPKTLLRVALLEVDGKQNAHATPRTLAINASLVDATNPTVFLPRAELEAAGLPLEAYFSGSSEEAKRAVDPVLEALRQAGARAMGLDPDAQAQPKIVVVSEAREATGANGDGADVELHALSMGVPHRAVPMTVGLCAGVAAGVPGTVVWEVVERVRRTQRVSAASGEDREVEIRIRHPSGVVDVGASFGTDGTVKSARVVRTGRRLMSGEVWY